MASLDEVLNFLVPAVLVLIAGGFIYTKFVSPWIIPHAKKLWEWLQGEEQQTTKNRVIVYDG